MARKPNTARSPSAQSQFRELTPDEDAQLAFECHRALLRLQAANPHLPDNPYFNQIILDSYTRFLSAFGRVR
jgi:hypothetical protein